MAADDPSAKVQALNSAFCHHIYSTALQYLQQQYSPEAVAQQFLDILERDDPYDSPCTVAHQDVNCSKNRYRDVVPYDHNRVALPPLSTAICSSSTATGSSNHSNSGGSQAAAGKGAGASDAGTRCSSNGGSKWPSGDGTYINASYMCDPRQAGEPHALGYIGTQGPLPSTVPDFWRMVAVTNTSAIVMLTGLTDGSPTLGNSRPRCAPYFPENEQDVLRLPDNISITCVHKNNLDDNVHFRQLEVVHPFGNCSGSSTSSGGAAGTSAASAPPPPTLQPQQQQHQQQQPALQQHPQKQQQPQLQRLWINHYQYAAWPDYGIPGSSASVLALSHALDGCRRTGCKIVVHCSAGVGRTGTFIAIDILLHRLHSLTLQLHGVTDADIRAAMDIPGFVANLRKQRRGTVQTGEQYAFIWQALMEELEMLLHEQQQLQQEQEQLQQGQQQEQEQLQQGHQQEQQQAARGAQY